MAVERLVRAVLQRKRFWLAGFILATLLSGLSLFHLRADASFSKMTPGGHPFIQNMLRYESQFGGSQKIAIAVRARSGTIFTPDFFQTLENVTHDVFLLPGVDRATVTSFFTANVRAIEVVDGGFRGGNVVPSSFEGTPAELSQVRDNIYKSAEGRRLLGAQESAALVTASLMDRDPDTGKPVDNARVSAELEKIRKTYRSASIDIHIIGFAKAVGDMQAGARAVVGFMLLAVVISGLAVWFYLSSWPLTRAVLITSALPVLWLLGLLPLLGYGIDPFSILVPFLIFAIGLGHAVQYVRSVQEFRSQGMDPESALLSAYGQLFRPSFLAFVTDAAGFLVLVCIPIRMLKELGGAAAWGVCLMVLANKVLLPILISRALLDPPSTKKNPWEKLIALTQKRYAWVVVVVSILFAGWGSVLTRGRTVGPLTAGFPELRDSARYNQDLQTITRLFWPGLDVFVLWAEGPPQSYLNPAVMAAIDRMSWQLRQVPGVRTVVSLADYSRTVHAVYAEGDPKWRGLPRDAAGLGSTLWGLDPRFGLSNADGSVMPIVVFLQDHLSTTLTTVSQAATQFAANLKTPGITFYLAGGNAGMLAAVNEVVDRGEKRECWIMILFVAIFLGVAFRNLRATLCILAPLLLSLMGAGAAMKLLGIGLTLATLPVVGVGIGVGVNYGIYFLMEIRQEMAQGASVSDAYRTALQRRGSTILFTAVTLSLGVATWLLSPLKLQADMGGLLAFLFLLNAVAALVILPAWVSVLFPPGSRS